MNLLEKYEKIKKDEVDLNIRKDMNSILKSILDGDEYTYFSQKETIEKLEIKKCNTAYFNFRERYTCRITKKLIDKVEKYFEEDGENNE